MLICSNWVVNNLTKALNTWNKNLADVLKLVTESPKNFKGGTMWSIIEKINGSMQAIGLSLLVLFFVVGILKSCSSFNEVKKTEHVFKYFIRFALAKVLVTYGLELLLAVFKIGQGVCAKVISASAMKDIIGAHLMSELPEEIITAITNCGFLESIPLWAVTLIGSLFITVMAYILIMTVYGRFFKLYIYIALAPIPLSTASGESTQHIAVTFIKSFCGVCLESAVIALGCIIFSYFASSPPALGENLEAINMVWAYVSEVVFNMLVLVGTVKASDRIIKEMMGL